MRPRLSLQLIALTILSGALIIQDASSSSLERLFSRRQSGEGEQESTTPKSQDVAPTPATSSQATGGQSNGNSNGAGSQPPRLYPDLLAQPPNFLPPFGASPMNGFRPTAFVPFGAQVPPTNMQQPVPFGRMPMQPRHMTPAERLQSQSFADGLGRRLLSLVGIDTADKSQADAGTTSTTTSDNQGSQARSGGGNLVDSTMKALQNSTILQQLNKGVNSMYAGLSKMYNSTVQEQLGLLQERFKAETENSTNPWHQRVAQQVPMFFKQMASKVAEAQDRLNGVWQDIAQAGTNGSNLVGTTTTRPAGGSQSRSFFAPIDQFMNGNDGGAFLGGQGQNDFFTQFGRSLGFNGNMFGDQQSSPSSPAPEGTMPPNQNDLGARLRDMWHNQIQPQIGIVRGQMARVWRDLTTSGVLTPDLIHRSRVANNNLGSGSNSSSNLVDSVLKEIDINSPDYSLVEPKSDGGQGESGSASATGGANSQAQQDHGIKLSPQMQNRLVEMQRELNQLWMGLSSSLQGALMNVRRTLNPRPQFGPMDAMASSGSNNNQQQEVNQAQNEIDDKIIGLTKLQKDVDMVHEAVQQQQQEAQRQTFGDRFKGLFNNIDMNGVNQWSSRVGDRLNQFGNAVGNIWNQIPNRWDEFMTNVRPQQQQQDTQAKLKASTSTMTSPMPA